MISKFSVEDEVHEAIERARASFGAANGTKVRVSQAEWLRSAVRAALAQQGIKVK